jgi:hypothetical protein
MAKLPTNFNQKKPLNEFANYLLQLYEFDHGRVYSAFEQVCSLLFIKGVKEQYSFEDDEEYDKIAAAAKFFENPRDIVSRRYLDLADITIEEAEKYKTDPRFKIFTEWQVFMKKVNSLLNRGDVEEIKFFLRDYSNFLETKLGEENRGKLYFELQSRLGKIVKKGEKLVVMEMSAEDKKRKDEESEGVEDDDRKVINLETYRNSREPDLLK